MPWPYQHVATMLMSDTTCRQEGYDKRLCLFWRCCPQGESRKLDSCTRLYDATVKIVTGVLGQELGPAPASG